MKVKKIIFPFWGYTLGILVFVLLVKFGFISTASIGISVSSLEVVLIIYALILGLVQVARQSHRLNKLSAIATELGNGRLDMRSNDLNFDSLGNLAHAFNKMADQLQKSFADLNVVSQNLESQNDELHEVLKTEARFGSFLESISTFDTVSLAKTGLRAFREILNSNLGWLVYFDPETHQQLCYRSNSTEFRGMPVVPYPGNMYEVARSQEWNYLEVVNESTESNCSYVLQIPLQFDGKPLGVILLEVNKKLEGRDKRLLGNYVEAFLNALSNCVSYQAALRQSVRMEEINKELLLADQNRTNFVARMSHELRTPLNSIIGFSKIMEKNKPGNLSELDLDRLEKIHRNGNHLLQMINNILNLSKAEAGEMHVEEELVNLDEVAGDVIDMLLPQAEAKNLYLRKEFENPGTSTLTDGLKIRQVLVNLVGNGIKFTQTGGVKVACGLCKDDRQFIHLDVTDTGIGIEADKHEKIFKAFSQADHSTAQEFGGTGLGLTISRSIVHLLGGTLELRSIPGKGSTFRIRLPLRLNSDPDQSDDPNVKKSAQNLANPG